MRYAQGGGFTAAEQQRRERLRLEAAEYFGHPAVLPHHARQSRVDVAEALQDRLMICDEVAVMDRSVMSDLVTEDPQVIDLTMQESAVAA